MIILMGSFFAFLIISVLGAFFVSALSAKGATIADEEIFHPNYAGWITLFNIGVGLIVIAGFLILYRDDFRGTPTADLFELGFIALLFSCAFAAPVLGIWIKIFKQKSKVAGGVG